MNRRQLGSSVLSVIVASVALALIPATAAAEPVVDGVFDLSGKPKRLTQGPDGNIWITLESATADLARVTPSGVVTPFDPLNITNPAGITSGPDGNLWVTQANEVARFSPADPNAAVKFSVAAIGADPRGIVSGPDDNLWAASGDQLVKIPPANPVGFTAFTIAGMSARGIASGGNGELWIADFGGGRIVSATTAGDPTFYPSVAGGGPQEVAAGAGTQIAFSDPTAMPQVIGRIESGGTAQTTETPMADPFGVAFGADGAYWFAQFGTHDLGRLSPTGEYTTLGGLPASSGPRYLTAGPGNTLWVGLETAEKVARVSGVEPPPDPSPGPTPEPPDTTAPELRLTREKLQRSTRAVVVTATCANEGCSLSARGRIAIKVLRRDGKTKQAISFKLKPATRPDAAPGAQNKLRLKLGQRPRKLLRRVIRKKRSQARVKVTATDAAGNTATASRQLRVFRSSSR